MLCFKDIGVNAMVRCFNSEALAGQYGFVFQDFMSLGWRLVAVQFENGEIRTFNAVNFDAQLVGLNWLPRAEREYSNSDMLLAMDSWLKTAFNEVRYLVPTEDVSPALVW